MEKVALGSAGFRIHPLVFGTLPLGPLQAGLSVEEGSALNRHALERGVRPIDAAELYRTYPYIREALRGYGGEPEEKVWQELENRRRRITVMAFCKGCGDCVPACTNEAL